MRCHSVRCGAANRMQSRMQFDYAKFRSRSHDAAIRVYDEAGNVIETHEHKGDFKSFESASQFPSSAHTASDETGSHWGATICKIRKIYA
jgi:hypothetical protein